MEKNKRPKARLYFRYPLWSVALYNGCTILYFLLGGAEIIFGYRFSWWAAIGCGVLYLAFSFAEMYAMMPQDVCPNCAYYHEKGARCISGLNIRAQKTAPPGDQKQFRRRARGVLCSNNRCMAAFVLPILAIIPALIMNYSCLLLSLYLVLIGLFLFRFLILLPQIACLHCSAKYICPQAGWMGVRGK